jgi:FimV-like protein
VAASPKETAQDRGLDFKIDFPDVNLNLDDKSAPAVNPAFDVKSAQWEEVQQKFDLALAYQEMGDKEGMLEALQEIEREGDAAQKAQAQKMIQEQK